MELIYMNIHKLFKELIVELATMELIYMNIRELFRELIVERAHYIGCNRPDVQWTKKIQKKLWLDVVKKDTKGMNIHEST